MSRVIHIVEFYDVIGEEWILDECYESHQNAVEVAEAVFGERNIEYRVVSFKELSKLEGTYVDYSNVNRDIEPLKKPEYVTSFRSDTGWRSNSQNPYAFVEDE